MAKAIVARVVANMIVDWPKAGRRAYDGLSLVFYRGEPKDGAVPASFLFVPDDTDPDAWDGVAQAAETFARDCRSRAKAVRSRKAEQAPAGDSAILAALAKLGFTSEQLAALVASTATAPAADRPRDQHGNRTPHKADCNCVVCKQNRAKAAAAVADTAQAVPTAERGTVGDALTAAILARFGHGARTS